MGMDTRYHVYNKCKYDIGVQLINGMVLNIPAGRFQILTGSDILFIESNCTKRKFFAQRMLVAVQLDGKEADISEIGIAQDDTLLKHLDDSEIQACLKYPIKKFEAWISAIEDPSELHAIYETAKNADLPASKLKILNAKIPDKEWLNN